MQRDLWVCCSHDVACSAVVFNMYDFDESGELTVDEITLALKSTLTGLAKMTDDTPPSEPELEVVAQDTLKRAGKDIDERLTRAEFVSYALHNPDMKSWVYFYDDAPDAMDSLLRSTLLDAAVAREAPIVSRTPAQIASMDPELFTNMGLLEEIAIDKEQEDEDLPMLPWKITAEHTKPTSEPTVSLRTPDIHAQLEWVHGYRAHDMRNNLWYTNRGEIVYPAASVGVVFNRERHQQRHNVTHNDEIMCLKVHVREGRTLVATGEAGPRPKIVVWDAESCAPLFTAVGFHKRGVSHIDFSEDGTRVISVGQDLDHSVALYDLSEEKGALLHYSSKSTDRKVLDLRYVSKTRFVSCGLQHVYFWDPSPIDGVYERKKGIYGRYGVKTCTAVAAHPVDAESVVSGTDTGQLLVWRGRNAVRMVNAHEGVVNVLQTVPNVGVLSGGSDAKIRVWFRDITPGLMFDIRSLGSLNPSIKALNWDSTNNKILIGTAASEVFEISDADGSDLHGGPIVQGHYRDELWGLAVHPTRDEFATVGDDQTLRIWDLASRKLLRMTRLDSPARAVAYAANGKHIAVGLGRPDLARHIHADAMDSLSQSRTTIADIQRKEGAFIILDEADLTILHEARDSKLWIRSVEFSPDGAVLAVGSTDKDVYLYSTADLSAIGKCRGHNGGVAHLDFSDDSVYLQSAAYGKEFDTTEKRLRARRLFSQSRGLGGAKKKVPPPKGKKAGAAEQKDEKSAAELGPGYELLFWDANTGEPQRNPATVRDVNWETYSAGLGYNAMGTWFPRDGDERAAVTAAVSRGPSGPTFKSSSLSDALVFGEKYCETTVTAKTRNGKVLAVGDRYGRIRLFRYPAFRQHMLWHELRGHGPVITNLRFTMEDRWMLSTSATDRCIFQWRIRHVSAETLMDMPPDTEAADAEEKRDEELMRTDDERERDPAVEIAKNQDMEALFEFEAVAERAGDKFMAVKPWVGSVVTPARPPKIDLLPPSQGLKLEWVHGYRAQDTRGNLAYTRDGFIVYTTAAMGVVLKKERESRATQRFHLDHTDDVIALGMHPNGNLVVTGQLGRVPKMLVWDARVMRTVRELGGHARGISHCAFSNGDGTLLASVGLDVNHSLVIHDWRNSRIVGRATGDRRKTLCLSFTPDNHGLVVGGVGFATFVDLSGRNMAFKHAVLEGKAKMPRNFTCVGWAGRTSVLGTDDGRIFRFDVERLVRTYDAHEGAVNVMRSVRSGVASGGRDGIVKLWSTTMELLHEFDVSKIGSELRPAVRGLDWDDTRNQLLIGTAASEIYEISSVSGADLNAGPLVTGHFAGQLHALAAHPSRAEVVTVGDDATVRVWDVPTKVVKVSTQLESAARSVAYSPDGLRLAVGYGGATDPEGKRKKDGGFIVLDARDLSVNHEGRDTKESVTDIRFTPDGNTLGLASADHKIYLYDISNAYTIKGVFDKHNSFITHMDFSADSQFLQSNCGAYELLFADATNGAYIPAASSLKDVEWDSFTCTLGWPVQGVWPRFADGTVINTVDRSHSSKVLAYADNVGRVSLVRYPCVNPEAVNKTYRGHSGEISRVCWAASDTHVVSIGRDDRCIFQWRVETEAGDVAEDAGDSGDDSDLDVFPEVDDEIDEGTEFLAVKPWISTIVPPTGAPRGNPRAPPVDVRLDWVHGMRAQDARGMARYNHLGQILYPAATLGVIFDKQKHNQDYFHEHNREVASLAVGPTGHIAATGELSSRPRVMLWDATTGHLVKKLPLFHRRGVTLLAFSPLPAEDVGINSGKTVRHAVRRLATVGLDDDHTVAVWRSHTGTWEDGHLEASEKSEKLKVLFAYWPSGESNGSFELVTGGVRHIKFWKIDGRNLKAISGVFGAIGRKQPLTCCTEVDGQLVTGTVTGHIYVWEKTRVIRAVKAHSATLNDIHSSGELLVTGGKDGAIKVWGGDIVNILSFNIAEARPLPFNKSIRSVALLCDKERSTILVATKASELYEISRASGRMLRLSTGHCAHETWGLAQHPINPDLFATAGDDHTIRIWSATRRQQVAMVAIETMTRAVEWSPDGSMLVVGVGGRVGRGRHRKDGAFLVLSAEDLSTLHEGQDSRDWISEVRFSPDGSMLAVGSQDTKVYLYDCIRDAAKSFPLKCRCERHNSGVKHLDFDRKGDHIRSNCGAHELLYYKTSDGEQVMHPSDLKDTKWATRVCPLTWDVQAIHPDAMDGAEVTTAHVSHDETLVASGDDLGRVKVFRFPAINKGAEFEFGLGHAAPIMTCRWLLNDEFFVTAGGADRCIMQWRVSRRSSPGAAPARSTAITRGGGGGASESKGKEDEA